MEECSELIVREAGLTTNKADDLVFDSLGPILSFFFKQLLLSDDIASSQSNLSSI